MANFIPTLIQSQLSLPVPLRWRHNTGELWICWETHHRNNKKTFWWLAVRNGREATASCLSSLLLHYPQQRGVVEGHPLNGLINLLRAPNGAWFVQFAFPSKQPNPSDPRRQVERVDLSPRNESKRIFPNSNCAIKVWLQRNDDGEELQYHQVLVAHETYSTSVPYFQEQFNLILSLGGASRFPTKDLLQELHKLYTLAALEVLWGISGTCPDLKWPTSEWLLKCMKRTECFRLGESTLGSFNVIHRGDKSLTRWSLSLEKNMVSNLNPDLLWGVAKLHNWHWRQQ